MGVNAASTIISNMGSITVTIAEQDWKDREPSVTARPDSLLHPFLSHKHTVLIAPLMLLAAAVMFSFLRWKKPTVVFS